MQTITRRKDRLWLVWLLLSLIVVAAIAAMAIDAAGADTFPAGYTTGTETYPAPSCAGINRVDDRGCGPVVQASVIDCGTVEFDPSVVKVTLHFYEGTDTEQYAYEVHDYEYDGSAHVVQVDTDAMAGKTGHVDFTWNIGSGVISQPFDCAPPETTTVPTTTATTVPPTTTPATTPPTEPQEHPTGTPNIGTPTSVIPQAGPAPITETPSTLAFTGSMTGPLALLGAVALAAGIGLVLRARRAVAR